MKTENSQKISINKQLKGDSLPEHLRNVLENLIFDESNENSLEIKGVLDRNVYEEFNSLMKGVGGKWKGSGKKNVDGSPKGKFIFDHINPKIFVDAVLESGVMPEKNPFAYFPTPSKIANDLVKSALNEYSYLHDKPYKILEPSAGTGGIADVLTEFCEKHNIQLDLDCVELNPINAEILRKKGYNVYEQDFLTFEPSKEYDIILMNPPFSVEGHKDLYQDHIVYAYDLLKKRNGFLAAITPPFEHKTDKKTRSFIDFAMCKGDIEKEYEEGEFKESGTNIATRLLLFNTERQTDYNREYNGHRNYVTWLAIVTLENNYSDFQGELFKIGLDKAKIKALVDRALLVIEKQGAYNTCLRPEDKENVYDYFYREVKSQSNEEENEEEDIDFFAHTSHLTLPAKKATIHEVIAKLKIELGLK